MTDIPKELDWVVVRANCSLASMFNLLKAKVQGDVEMYNRMQGTPKFSVHFNGTDFTVLRGDGGGVKSVVFFLEEFCIRVTDGDRKEQFRATLTLNDAGECRLKVGGEELELWQIRKRALEMLFFGKEPGGELFRS